MFNMLLIGYAMEGFIKNQVLAFILISVLRVMIAQWDSSLSVLPVTRVQFPTTAEYLKGFFPG